MKKLFPFVVFAGVAFTGCSKNESVADTNAAATTTSAFSIDNQSTAKEGTAVQFRNTSGGAVSYKWDFGNGKTSTEKEPAFTYPSCGIYTVQLTVTDAAGKTTTASHQLEVNCIFMGTNGVHAPLF